MNWARTNLGEFAPFSYGKSLPKEQRIPGAVPVYGSNGVVGSHNAAFVDGPSVIIGRKGSVGEVHLSELPSWPIDTAFFAQGSDKADLNFLYYLLKALPITSNSDSAVPGLNRDFAHSLEFHVPPFATQKAIGLVLRVLDKKIDLNIALSKTLEDVAQTIFKSWFIDFDPVRAKIAGETPVGLNNEISSLLPDSFVDSEIGSIPGGWVVRGLDEISEYLNGLAMQKFPVVDELNTLPVIKIAQLRAGNTDGADVASGLLDHRFVVKDGDILFSWSGTLEVEIWAGGRGALNQHLFKVTGVAVPDWYAYLSTCHHLPTFRAIASGKATTMGHIQRGHLSEAKIAVPPKELLEATHGILQPILDLKLATLVSNRTLEELRDSLLPRLVSGELQIPEDMVAS